MEPEYLNTRIPEHLNVAQVVRPAAGGMRRHLVTLLSGLDDSRFSCTLYAPAGFDLGRKDLVCRRVDLEIGSRTRPLADLRTIAKLTALLRGQTDLVHAHGLRGALIGVLAARRAGIPALFTAHNLIPQMNRLSRRMLQTIGQYAQRILVVSQAVADSLAAGGIQIDKIVVVPNGIDPAPFQVRYDPSEVRARYRIAPESPLIVAIGRLSHEKGFDLLIEAYRRLQHSISPVVALVGTGPAEAELRAQAAELPPDRFRFTGAVADVAPLIAAADVVAIPSRQEGQGIVALEAMAAGKPVAAAHVGGLVETVAEGVGCRVWGVGNSESVIEGECGLLVPAENSAALAEALQRLLSDDVLRTRLGQAGRQRVQREYTAERMVERVSEIYEVCHATAR